MIPDLDFDAVEKNTSKTETAIISESDRSRILASVTVNNNDSECKIDARLEIQRKGNNISWDEVELEKLDRRHLLNNQSFVISLNSNEFVKLSSYILSIKESFSGLNIPIGHYVNSMMTTSQLSKFIKDQFCIKTSNKKEITHLFCDYLDNTITEIELIKHLIESKFDIDKSMMSSLLSKLKFDDLMLLLSVSDKETIPRITASYNLERLKIVKNEIRKMLDDKSLEEECWQKYFGKNFDVLSLITPLPIVLYKEKAYVGGKDPSNKGGSEADFWSKNSISLNSSLIEIKTPYTNLVNIGKTYRNRVYSPGEDVVGGIVQLLHYKDMITKNYYNLYASKEENEDFRVSNPMCILIIGNYEKLKKEGNRDMIESFELYRSNQKDVSIITFDELIEKIDTIIRMIESKKDNSDQAEK